MILQYKTSVQKCLEKYKDKASRGLKEKHVNLMSWLHCH